MAQRQADYRKLCVLIILIPATLSMPWLIPRLPHIEQAEPGFRLRVHTTHTGEDWLALPHDAAVRRDGFLPPDYWQELLFQEELAAYLSPKLLDCIDNHGSIGDVPPLGSLTKPGEASRILYGLRSHTDW